MEPIDEFHTESGKTIRTIFIIHGSHYLTDHAFNGDGLVAWGFISELARRGHNIHVATDKLDVMGAIPSNLTIVEFPRRYGNPILHYLDYMMKVRSYFRQLHKTSSIDIVHQMNPVVRGISLALIGTTVPIVLGTYVGDWVRLKSAPNYRKPGVRRLLSGALKTVIDALQQHFASSLLLATPHALKRIPLSVDVADRITFLHHGVDTSLYSPVSEPDDPPTKARQILYVGSIQPNKGVFTLVDALPRVVSLVPEATLVIVGRGKFVSELKTRLEVLGLADRVHFAGLASRREVAGWMRSSELLCAPSFGEPYGQNVLEAMACGLAVILTNTGGHRFLSDAEGFISVTPGNRRDLEAALVAILTDEERRVRMASHNRRLAVERHAWARVTDQLEAIYERAVAAHSTS